MRGTVIRVVNQDWGAGLSVLICQKDYEGVTVAVAKELVLTKIEEGAYVEPTLRITKDAGQQLMDELWNCGLRPSEGTGSAGALAAVQYHLEDMRKLVFREKQ